MYHWLTIGEAMQSGAMYKDIFDPVAPLSAVFYWLIVLAFGKSILVLHILGTLLLVIQAIIFNNLTIENKVYEQNTYLPAFTFLILSLSHYSLSVFSPAQLGMTFILLAYSRLLSHVEFRAKRDEQIMSIGLYLGLAVLFYFQFVFFIPIVLVVLMIYTNTLSRRYVILIVNAFTPLAIAFAYYWIVNKDAGYILVNMILPSLSINTDFVGEIWTNIIFIIPVLLFFLAGLITMPQQRRLNNYQNRLSYLLFLTTILSFSVLLLNYSDPIIALVILVPWAAFYSTHLFFLVKSSVKDLGVSLLFLFLILFVNFDSAFKLSGMISSPEKEIVIAPELDALIRDKKIMILGDYPELYHHSKLATPFYNWELAQPIINNLDYYDNLVFIKESLDNYQPDIILDYEHHWTMLQERIPELKEEYKFVQPFVWSRVDH